MHVRVVSPVDAGAEIVGTSDVQWLRNSFDYSVTLNTSPGVAAARAGVSANPRGPCMSRCIVRQSFNRVHYAQCSGRAKQEQH